MNVLLALDLWSPHHGLPIGIAILTAFALGLVHGFVAGSNQPDVKNQV